MKKTAMITGATGGIGEAIATALAKDGYDLVLTYHTQKEKCMQMKETLITQYGIQVSCYAVDVSSYEEVHAMFETIPQIDVLINNAGKAYIGLLQDMSVDTWNQMLSTNLSSAFYTCHEAIPIMLRAGHGQIINISSVWGNVGASMEVCYSACKGGMNSFTKALAKELAPSNITVNALAPGVIDTPMNHCFSEEEREALREEIPADRFGTPSEVADMILHLIHAPSYLTGQVITMDGGWY